MTATKTGWEVKRVSFTHEAKDWGKNRVPYPFWVEGFNHHRNGEEFHWCLPYQFAKEYESYDFSGATFEDGITIEDVRGTVQP